jgi:hypothetical protein
MIALMHCKPSNPMSKISNILSIFLKLRRAVQAVHRRFWLHFFILLWFYGSHMSNHRVAYSWIHEDLRTGALWPALLVESFWTVESLTARTKKRLGIHFLDESKMDELPFCDDVHVMCLVQTLTGAVFCFLAHYKALPTLFRMNSIHLIDDKYAIVLCMKKFAQASGCSDETTCKARVCMCTNVDDLSTYLGYSPFDACSNTDSYDALFRAR